jgi:hypothetical protein
MVEEFTFDDRDFALADQNETRKIWAEKYLELGPGTEEAEHFALYKTLQSVLIEKLTNEAHTSFVVPFPLDPSLDSSTTLRPYSWALDRGETLVGLKLKSGPFVTTIPAVERKNGRCVLHFLSMSPLPAPDRASKMFLPWFSKSLFDQLFRDWQEPASVLAFHAPTLNGSGFVLLDEEPATERAKEHAMNKWHDVLLSCFREIATSPVSPPSHGNIYPPLDYAGLDSERIIRALSIQSAVAERWGSFSKIFSTQTEDLNKLNQPQLARANGLECVREPCETEFPRIIAFAAISVPLRSCLTEKDGKLAPAAETTPVLERFVTPTKANFAIEGHPRMPRLPANGKKLPR